MRPFEKLIQEQDANQWLQPNFPEPFAWKYSSLKIPSANVCFFFFFADCVRIDPFDEEKGSSAGAGLEFIHFDLVWLG